MLYKHIVRPALFALSQGDNETAHEIAKYSAHIVQRTPLLLDTISLLSDAQHNPHPVRVCGITFPNRVGIAAGLDKDADMLLLLQAFGPGFAEVGTILPRPQKGNKRPRLFRLPEQGALINRMGFNSAGVEVVEQNLRKLRTRLRIPVIASLGKMKDTPLEYAAEDYTIVAKRLWPYVDAFTVNVSSPNTPDLRKLQGKEYLENLVRAVVEAASTTNPIFAKPVFVKIAPDLTQAELTDTYEAAMAGGARGFIACNTTTTRPIKPPLPKTARESGGLSGPPVFPLMIEKLRQLRQLDQDVPIAAVGGINSLNHGRQAFDEGATLIQALAGLVYEGPGLIRRLRTL